MHFAEIDGKIAGMLLGYDGKIKKKENLRTGLLLFKKMGIGMISQFPTFMRFNATIGKLGMDEYYISNIAVYPEYRRRGVGKKLIFLAHEEARNADVRRVVLDVEKDNPGAIKLYEKLGYKVIKEFSIRLRKNGDLHFYRMEKDLW